MSTVQTVEGGHVSNNYHNVGPVITAGTVEGNLSTITIVGPLMSADIKPDPIYFGFKEPHPNFTGRLDELKLLKKYTISPLNSTTDHKAPVLVYGLGGMGKTQLVRKFIADNRSSFYNVIWINSQERSKMLGDFTNLAKLINISTQDDDWESLIAKVFMKMSKSSTAIVFDNLDKIENEEIIKNILTLGTPDIKPHIFITSRIQEWSDSLNSIKLTAFKSDDAFEYVTKKLNDPDNIYNDSFEDKVALVNELQYFPLAMVQAVAHINFRRRIGRVNINDYIHEFNSLQAKILESKYFQEDILNLYEQTTLTTWTVTIKAIKKCKAFGDLALRILQIISFFEPDHIRRDIFFNLNSALSGQVFAVSEPSSTATDVQQVVFDEDVEKVTEAVGLLVNYSMIDSYNSQNILSVHRLVQQVTKIVLERDVELKKNILRDCLHLISEMERHDKFIECVEHGIPVFKAALTCTELVHKFRTFPTTILVMLNEYGKYNRALNFGNEIGDALRAIIGDENPEARECMCNFLSNTANSYFYMGNYKESLVLHQFVLGKQWTIYDENDPHMLISMSNIANICDKLGNHHEALQMHQMVFEGRSQALGEDHEQTLHSLSNIAITYYNLGNYSEALKKQREAYEKRKTVLGEVHPHTLDSMSCIANTLEELGHHSESYQMHQEVYKKRKIVSGEDHPQTLLSLSNVAVSCFIRGEIAEALGLYQVIFEKRKKVLGESHPATLESMYSIAKAYYNMDEYAEALRSFQSIFEIQKKVFGEDHPDTLDSIGKVAFMYNNLGEHSKALEIEKKVYDKLEKVSGGDHPNTLKSLSSMAHTYDCLGEYFKALQTYESVYDKQTTGLEEDDEDALRSLSNIANVLNKLGKHSDVLQKQNLIFDKRKKLLGEDHLDTLKSMYNLAKAHHNMDDHTEALRTFQSLFSIQQNVFGENHPDTLESMKNIASLNNSVGNHSEALEISKKVYEKLVKVQGEDHPDTFKSMSHIAYTYNKLGEHTEALRIFQLTFENQKKVLGDDHYDSLHTMSQVAHTYNKLGDHAKARPILQSLIEIQKKVSGADHPDTQKSIASIEAMTASNKCSVM